MSYTLFSFSTIPFFCLIFGSVFSQLDYNFYVRSCPGLPVIVSYGISAVFKNNTIIAASLLRLHFHDCFVNGCEGSILLDDTNVFRGEKNALPNRNSALGYEVIDNIKADVERACPSIVSCTDILALAAREAVVLSGGPFWPVQLGRRNGISASENAANEQLPSPIEPLENITAKFASKGLCGHTLLDLPSVLPSREDFDFKGTGKPDLTVDSSFLSNLQSTCPNVDSSNAKLAPLDAATVSKFDHMHYTNLMNNEGLLQSDQAFTGDPKTAPIAKYYSDYPYLSFNDFSVSMMKLGNIGVLSGNNGQIRKKCGSVN